MKTFISFVLILSIGFTYAQQVSLGEISRLVRFTKTIDEVNNGKTKLKYSDIQGIPYYYDNFANARVGDTSSIIPIRYNSFLDTIEVLDKTDVYEIPKEESYPKFTFEKTNEKLVLVNTHNEFSGYFFEMTSGKNRILKKVTTKFHDAIPAPNSLIPGTSARFEIQKPIYFIETENGYIRVPKNSKDLLAIFPDKKGPLSDFLKNNKIKLNNEADLIKLGIFFNQ